MRNLLLLFVVIAAMLFASASAETGYMRLSVEGIGAVRGEATAVGREGMIEVYGFSHEVLSPRDSVSGRASGRRTYEPIVIRKRIDAASPLLARAFREKLKITSLTLDVPDPAASTSEQVYYTIQLENATITSIDVSSSEEEITFGYDKIHRLTR
ncbi:MAG: hypothetical protein DHS20C04_21530 [Hyphococcus sp.]|nr:MAG: hypothetical protein DHS20C04_21530 [Marinicaulis sp.]